MDLVSLAVLAAIAERGSISAAGLAAGLTQQAASARMRRLEERLGLALLHRGPRGTSLTAEGEIAAQWAADVVTAAERFAVGASALRGRRTPLSVAASLTIAEYLLPAWLLAVRDGGRDVPLSVTATNSATVVELVRSGSHPLGFIESPQDIGDLRSVTIARDELVLVVAPTHPWANRASITATQLAKTPLIVREEGSGTRLSAERMMLDAGHTPHRPLLELPTTAAIRTVVAAGAGPAVLSILAVRDDIASGRLARVRIRDLRFIRELRAIYAASAALDPELQSLLRAATRNAQADSPSARLAARARPAAW
ncbi:LysR family transcriptional regulator [Microbacterium sp. X-17]|uniref:LysR family transcriptional regulator n=1 Tax=Microbacterium sp. X-17 TaxID=3144404 RepID=UPI0031F4B240